MPSPWRGDVVGVGGGGCGGGCDGGGVTEVREPAEPSEMTVSIPLEETVMRVLMP